jgi:c-di-GMP-binding flagellar brake protein YcgR
MPPAPPNRRAHQRYETSLSVEIYTAEDVVHGVAKNLSLGGLGVGLDRTLPAQQQVGLSMFLTEEGIEDELTDPLNVRGEIIWCTEDKGQFLAGLRFSPLQPKEQERIQHFLRRLTQG